MDKYTVRNSDGSVDVEASASNYVESLKKWVSERDNKRQSRMEIVPNAVVQTAVEEFFDSHNQRVPKPVLISHVVNKINPSLDKYSAVTRQVKQYVDQQIAAGRFNVLSRKGGGVVRGTDSSE